MGSKRITSTPQADNYDCDGGDKKQNKQRRKPPQPYQLMIEVVMIRTIKKLPQPSELVIVVVMVVEKK